MGGKRMEGERRCPNIRCPNIKKVKTGDGREENEREETLP